MQEFENSLTFNDDSPGPGQTLIVFRADRPLIIDDPELRVRLETIIGPMPDGLWKSLWDELHRQRLVHANYNGRQFFAIKG